MSEQAPTIEAPASAPVVTDPQNLLAVQPASTLATPTMDDFMSIKTGKKAEETPAPLAEVKQPEAEPKVPKVELPEFKPFENQPAKTEPLPKSIAKKDFTGFAEADLPKIKELAERMSDRGFAELRRLYLADKENQTKLAEFEAKAKETTPASFYTHPEGYKLTEEYTNKSYIAGIANKLTEHWMEQYEKVQLGEPWVNASVNQKTGEIEYSAPQPIVPEQRARMAATMLKQVNQASMLANQLNQEVNNYVQGYGAKVQEANNSISGIRQNFFKGWEAKEHPTQPLQKQYMEQLHPSHRENPFAQLFVMGKILFDAAQARIKELETQVKGKATNAQIPVQPGKAETVLQPNNGKHQMPTMDDFLAAKRK